MSRVRNKVVKSLGNGQTLVHTTGTAGIRGIRCSHCHSQVAPSKDAQNRTVYKCICGSTFQTQAM